MKIAVSACLLGTPCRYNGTAKPCEEVLALRGAHEVVPVCPEVAGGLRVPHPPSEVVAGAWPLRVVDDQGTDNTEAFVIGARATLARVQERDCHLAILKAKSPSCGCGQIYDGTFANALVPGYGVTTRLLRDAGVRVVDEVRFQGCLDVGARLHPGARPALLADSSAECSALVTRRLVLRPLVAADAPAVFAYGVEPEVGLAAGWEPYRAIDDARAFVEVIAAAPHVFGIFERLDGGGAAGRVPVDSDAACPADTVPAHGPCIGSIGFVPDSARGNPDSLALGYALAKPAWGRGYMTEAARELVRYGFEELALAMVGAECFCDNVASARVLEKCGFACEGVAHAARCAPCGSMRDVRRFYLTEQMWRDGRAAFDACALKSTRRV